MSRYILNIFMSLLLLIFATPSYSIEFSPKEIENYTLKISRKFSKTYCNSIKFGISKDGALKFSIGETNKEFSNNKFNNYVDYELLNTNILLNVRNNCQIFDFPEYELRNLAFKD
tara:strand:- start:123 stop:467 length:345 start_codon:yes stop_codon:yes gene_type:complete